MAITKGNISCGAQFIYSGRFKGAATSRKKKISKKYNIGVIDLKFTQYIPMMVSDIVYK